MNKLKVSDIKKVGNCIKVNKIAKKIKKLI